MLCLLGPAAVAEGGVLRSLTLRPTALALLTYLALQGGAVRRDALARLLVPDAEAPRAALRWQLAHLRAALPPAVAQALHASRDTVTLATRTDVAAFREGVTRILRQPDAPDAAAVLALYRADLLSGLAVSPSPDFDIWLYVEQEGLRRLLRRATVAFARTALDRHRAADTLGPLARLVSVDPYYEEGHVLLVEAYAQLDEQERAAAAYDRYQRIMRQELQSEPRAAVARRFERLPVPSRPEPRDELIPLRDVTIHVVDWPGGEPAVLAIHGTGGSAYAMTALAERLAPRHRFVALDLRGHGFSDKPPAGYDLACHVEDVRQLIEALALRRPALLGFSAGGAIAAFVAGRAALSGLILLEAVIGDRAFVENAAAQMAPVIARLGQRFGGFDAYLAALRAQPQRPRYSSEAERLVDRFARLELAPLPDGTYRERPLRAAVEAEWASIMAADSLGALARVTCPILIVQAVQPFVGGRPYFTDAIIAAQRRAAPAAELFVATRSAHPTLIRDPEPAMVAAIAAFLDTSADAKPAVR
jgi:pimeloyl-ACP methyl ester carboxylesterase/DNA-binding SARP family transcriptional activator